MKTKWSLSLSDNSVVFHRIMRYDDITHFVSIPEVINKPQAKLD